jgi:hypothetical protein
MAVEQVAALQAKASQVSSTGASCLRPMGLT